MEGANGGFGISTVSRCTVHTFMYVVRYRYIQVRTGSKVVLKAVQVQYRVAVVQGGRCTGYTKLN